MEHIAIIPCRAGSKRIPNKNRYLFYGKPFYERAAQICWKTAIFSQVVVFTNDKSILLSSPTDGTNVIRRKESNAQSKSTTIDAVREAILQLDIPNPSETSICCVYPCTPFLEPRHLLDTLDVLKTYQDDFIYPVKAYSHPVQRRMILKENRLHYVETDHIMTPTQDLEKHYHDAGQFYWAMLPKWLSATQIHDNAVGLDFTNEYTLDIDYPEDLKLAELIYKATNHV